MRSHLININVFLILRVGFFTFPSPFFRHWLFLFNNLRIIFIIINFSFFATFLILWNLFFLFFLYIIKIYNIWQNIFFLDRFSHCLFSSNWLWLFFFLNFINFSFLSGSCFWFNRVITFWVYMMPIKKDIFKFIKYLFKLF